MVIGNGLAIRSVVLKMMPDHSLSAYWITAWAVPPTFHVTFQASAPLSSGLLCTSSLDGIRITRHCGPAGAGGSATLGPVAALTGVIMPEVARGGWERPSSGCARAAGASRS